MNIMSDTTLEQTYLTFGLGDELAAVPVARVREILDVRPIMPLPRMPDYLLGFIDLRGDSIVVIDLRLLLGMPYRDNNPDTRIIVLWISNDGREQVVALRTDHVREVTRLDEDRLASLESQGLLGWDNRIVRGVGRRSERFVTVLELDEMFKSDVIAAVRQELKNPSADKKEEKAEAAAPFKEPAPEATDSPEPDVTEAKPAIEPAPSPEAEIAPEAPKEEPAAEPAPKKTTRRRSTKPKTTTRKAPAKKTTATKAAAPKAAPRKRTTKAKAANDKPAS